MVYVAQPDSVQPEIMPGDIMQSEPPKTDSIEPIRGSTDKDDTKQSSPSSGSLVFSGKVVERKHQANSTSQLVLAATLVIGAAFSVPPIIFFMQRNEAQFGLVESQSEFDKLRSNCGNSSRSLDTCKNCPGQADVFTTRVPRVNPKWIRDILEKFPNERFVTTWQLRVYLTGEGEIDLKDGFSVLTLLRDEHNKTHGQLVELTSHTKDEGRLICVYTYETENAVDIVEDIRKHVEIIGNSNQRNVLLAHPITLESIADVDVSVELKITASSRSLEFHYELIKPPEGRGHSYNWSTPLISNPFGVEAVHVYAYNTLMKTAAPTFVSEVSCT